MLDEKVVFTVAALRDVNGVNNKMDINILDAKI
jgi:hypothetical protein